MIELGQLRKSEIDSFFEWLDLDLSSIAWEGKFKKSFDLFQELLFNEHTLIEEVAKKIDLLKEHAGSGPIYSWLKWLGDQFALYIFSIRNCDIAKLCQELHLDPSYFGHILRIHLLEVYPDKEHLINEHLELGAVRSPSKRKTFQMILKELEISELGSISSDIEMMKKLEVTIFPQWKMIIKELEKNSLQIHKDLNKKIAKENSRGIKKFVFEFCLLVCLGLGGIYSMGALNQFYERFLLEKIQLLEPLFIATDQSLAYKSESRDERKIDLSNKEIEELERVENLKILNDLNTNRYEPETDEVVLTSVEDIPRSFEEIDEDGQKKLPAGYRNMTWFRGGRKAYRVLLTSIDPEAMKEEVNKLLYDFEANREWKFVNGKRIPGGIYFNFYLPRKNLKDFLSKMSQYGDATIFESNSREKPIPGANRVFIWIKSI